MNVIKRDGSIQQFNYDKIRDAARKAFESAGEELTDTFVTQLQQAVEKFVANKDSVDIEDIQDVIQKELIKRNKYNVVEAFITYRKERERIRLDKSDLGKQIADKLSGKKIVNQNANLDEASFGGRIGEMASAVLKDRALKTMRKQSRLNHENNEVYIHDLDAWCDGRHNCLSIPFDDLLKNGFKTRQVHIRPAGSVNTAMQLVAVIFQLQSLQQFGGVSATHLDWTMVPYVRKSFAKHYKDGLYYIEHWSTVASNDYIKNIDVESTSIYDVIYQYYKDVFDYAYDKTESEIHQAAEGLLHNLNSLQSRSGNQLPFTSVNFGTCTLEEGRMVTRAILEVTMEGLGPNGETSIFPCSIFQYMKGVNDKPGTPNYDLKRLALECTAKRIYPNYVNVDWSINKGYDPNDPVTYCSTMGCRTYNGSDINALPGQNPQMKDGRGNICPVTVILPTIAMKARLAIYKKYNNQYNLIPDGEIWEEFKKRLLKKMSEAKDTLIERFNHIASQSPDSAKFMYENNVMYGYVPEEGIISALKHGTLALGQIGLAEALQILFWTDQTTDFGMYYAKEIEQLFKDKCAEWKQEYKLNIGVYYTPAEGLCYTAMNNFRKMFPNFHQENVTYLYDKSGMQVEKKYFTNSIHVPVWVEVDPFKKIDIEAQLTNYSNAGCITYVELDTNCMNNIEAMETVVDYAMEKDIPYFAINTKIRQCKTCRERIWDAEVKHCPKCGCTEYEDLGRVTGYLSTTVQHFNEGKKDEFYDRIEHTNQEIDLNDVETNQCSCL